MTLVWKLPCHHMVFCITFSPACQSCIENLGCVTKCPRVEGMVSKTGLNISGWVLGKKKKKKEGFSRAVSLEFASALWMQHVQVSAVSKFALSRIPAQRKGVPGRRECPSYSSDSLSCALCFIVHFPFHLYLHPASVCPHIFCFLSKCKGIM